MTDSKNISGSLIVTGPDKRAMAAVTADLITALASLVGGDATITPRITPDRVVAPGVSESDEGYTFTLTAHGVCVESPDGKVLGTGTQQEAEELAGAHYMTDPAGGS